MDEPVPLPRAPIRANRPQLLTYPDSLGGTIGSVTALLRGPLAGLFSGVHVLPPFPSSADRGFAPITYERIDPRFGTWSDIEDLARTHAVLLDVMVNHISRHSPEFQAFARHGTRAATADLFLTPGGDLAGRRPGTGRHRPPVPPAQPGSVLDFHDGRG